MMKHCALLLLVFLLSSCGQMQHELAGSSWLLQSYGPKDAQQNVLGNTTVTLVFDKTSAGGSSGCNSYGGELSIQGKTFSMKNIVSTLKACTDPGIMEQEASYLDLLQRVTTFEKTDTTLTLITGEARLEFIAQ